MTITTDTGSTLQQLSRPGKPAVHRYYDVPVDSPDGKRILYTEFDSDQVPGPAKVIVANADGSDPQVVGACAHAIGHVGAYVNWIDDRTFAFCPDGPGSGVTVLRSLDGAPDRQLDGQIRSFSEPRRLGVLLGGPAGMGSENEKQAYLEMQKLALWEMDTDRQRTLITVEQAAAVHPMRDQFDAAHSNFMNCKWSPDGSQLMVVFTDNRYRQPRGLKQTFKSLIVLNADPDNPAPQYVGEFRDHPIWAPSGRYLIGHNNWDGRKALMAYPLDGNDPYPLLTDVNSHHPSLNRAETHLVTDGFDYSSAEAQGMVLLYELATGKARTLAAGHHYDGHHQTGSHIHPVFSRDESRVFFNLGDSGVAQVYAVTI